MSGPNGSWIRGRGHANPDARFGTTYDQPTRGRDTDRRADVGSGGRSMAVALMRFDDPDEQEHLAALCRSIDVVASVTVVPPLDADGAELATVDADVVVLAYGDRVPHAPATIRSLRRMAPDVRVVVWADETAAFDELFRSGADAWVSRRVDAWTLRCAVTGEWRR